MLVLGADARQGLVCVRQLGRLGLSVGALDCTPSSPAFASRWCRVRGLLPDPSSNPQGFLDAVVEAIERHEPKVVIPVSDGIIDVLRRARAAVERRAALALAREEALATAVDKSRTHELAATTGVPTPRSVRVETVAEISAALAEVGLPAVLKPVQSWVEKKGAGQRLSCAVVRDLAGARESAGRTLEAGSAILVQEWVTGSREAVSIFYAEGRIWARFAQIAHRMHPPLGGVSVLRESIPVPSDIGDAAEALVVAAGLEGYSEVEFRRDASGTARLMEINPRLSASVEVAVRAGVDFPALLYGWAIGSPLQETTSYRDGVRMRWFGGDLRWLRQTLLTQGQPDVVPARWALTTFIGDCFRPASYDYLDAADPRPAIRATHGLLARARRLPQPGRGSKALVAR